MHHVSIFVSSVRGVGDLRRQALGTRRVSSTRLRGSVRERLSVLKGRGEARLSMYGAGRVFYKSRRIVVRILRGLLSGTVQCSGRRVSVGMSLASRLLAVSMRSSKGNFLRSTRGMADTFRRGGVGSDLARANVKVCLTQLCYRGRKKGLLLSGRGSNKTVIATMFRQVPWKVLFFYRYLFIIVYRLRWKWRGRENSTCRDGGATKGSWLPRGTPILSYRYHYSV